MSYYLDQLNDQQRAAVEYIDGPELVIAGAGSGKTRVLTYKIVHLLANGYEPWRIMALTFTNKAAREMRERITALSGVATASKLWMGTFHSIFARILRLHADRLGFRSSFTIYDTADSRSLIKTIIRDMGLDEKVYKPATVASSISTAKNALLSPEAYASDRDIYQADMRAHRPRIGEIYAAYRNRCHVAEAMDFDDLLYYTNILLRDNPDIRRHYQEYFRYILVDEYQDTNFAQHAIVTQLSGEAQKICVVGDDAQSIYSFRGANIRNILNLKRNYPNLALFKLEQNYRSTENIINAAGTLIAKNTEQIPKEVFSTNGSGSRVEVVRCYSDFEESSLVANRIAQLKRTVGGSYEEFAVLYRTNAQSRLLEESLRKRNIPYRIYGGQSFYTRKEVKDAIAYFRLAVNPHDDEALKRVINIPARGIGETTLKKLVGGAMSSSVSVWTVVENPALFNVDINRGTAGKIARFADIVRELGRLAASGVAADELVRAMFIQTNMLSMYQSDRTPENVSKLENLQELLNEASAFVADRREIGDEEHIGMVDFMTELSLKTDADNEDDDQAGEKVTLMTIHASKGLEFSNIFVTGVEEDLLPSMMSQSTLAEIEEERRLLYVAITRAKEFCMLSYASSRMRNGQTVIAKPSRFLSDIDRSYLRFVTGSEIEIGSSSSPVWTKSRPSVWTPTPKKSTSTTTTTTTSFHSKPATSEDGEFTLHDVSELSTGMTVLHPRFGRGVIAEVDSDNPSGDRIIVCFEDSEKKTLLLKYAKFKLV